MTNIAFTGKAGSGKTSAAELLMESVPLGYRCLSFADPLKLVVGYLWGEKARRDRGRLQNVGDALRAEDPDVFARAWLKRTRSHTGPLLCDDLRRENEWWAAKEAGFVIVRVHSDRGLRIERLRAN